MKIKHKIDRRIFVLEAKNEKLKTETKLGQRLINSFKVNLNNEKIKELKKLLE
jgi:hypothetical protein